MEMAKIRNITIVALLLVNVFFLSMIVTGRIKEAGRGKEIYSAVSEACERQNIVLLEDSFVTDESVAAYNAVRDTAKERAITQSLIGSSEMTEQGGNINVFRNDKGSVTFRSSGGFSAEISEAGVSGHSAASKASSLMKKMGLEYGSVYEDGEAAFVCCAENGKDIFNCVLRMDFGYDGSVSISGMLPQPVASSKNTRIAVSEATAVTAVIAAVKNGDAAFRAIEEIDLGYISSYSVFGDSILSPVWRISTDHGQYYVDVVTGEVENVG